MTASGIVLAGGKNSRMGLNKALLRIEQRTFLEQTISILSKFCSEIIVVTNQPEIYQQIETDRELKLVQDIIPQKGPLSGIHAGLTYSTNFYNFIVACDMPFLSEPLGRYQVDNAVGYDVYIPKLGEYLQPLHAVYSKQCLTPIEQCLHQQIYKVTAFFPQVKAGYLEENQIAEFVDVEQVFFNVNTLEDLEAMKEFKRGSGL